MEGPRDEPGRCLLLLLVVKYGSFYRWDVCFGSARSAGVDVFCVMRVERVVLWCGGGGDSGEFTTLSSFLFSLFGISKYNSMALEWHLSVR